MEATATRTCRGCDEPREAAAWRPLPRGGVYPVCRECEKGAQRDRRARAKAGPRALGARRALTPDRAAMVARHAPLAISRAAKVADPRPDLDRDAIFSAAFWGLSLAALSYDPARGTRFSTHARPRIDGAILDELLGSKTSGRRHKGNPAAVHCHDLSGFPAPDDGAVADIDHRDAVESYARRLTPRRASMIRLCHGPDAATIREAGRRLGVSEDMAAVLLQQAYGSLRKQLTA